MAPLRGSRLVEVGRAEDGSVSVEYALVAVAIAGLAATLFVVLSGDAVRQALSELVMRALTGGT
ncbi:DUF4244 domain-containing protein [Goodfellowiella coeruleoviolacea]|uniref:DUF4244 domain-containing protein n=1 Tax=Goodfellowiella coeruleoviolacea TaxID=334858 RepID=A0AAE3KF67_9PSEU|nr:DUF4244 domain-containing protein [Goodfellowiella coeruleoviolacea]MCP2164632.1 Protein of unknown function (DUF4244) [Goodfellowiella coeruleoviolacea]